jgi:site-specific DNA-adenine methylase
MNCFVPQTDYVENNIWGTGAGRGAFSNTFDKVKRGVEYAEAPTERYVENGDTRESPAFSQPIGRNADVRQEDMREIEAEDEYDLVLTDPPTTTT